MPHLERKCQMPNCTELATVKVSEPIELGGFNYSRVRYYCEGHAFVRLGQLYGNCYLECPICHSCVRIPHAKRDC